MHCSPSFPPFLAMLRCLVLHLLPAADQFRGASALVRMASLEAADRAINALNNNTPPGAVQSLIVRFAESATEKAARLTRREAKNLQRVGGSAAGGGSSGSLLSSSGGNGAGGLAPDTLQQALSALTLGGSVAGLASGLRGPLPAAPLVPQSYQPQVISSICVKGKRVCVRGCCVGQHLCSNRSAYQGCAFAAAAAGMPGNADRLWMFENFSRYGAVVGLRVLVDEASGLCNGTGCVAMCAALTSSLLTALTLVPF